MGLGALAPVMKAVGLGAAGAVAKQGLKNILGGKNVNDDDDDDEYDKSKDSTQTWVTRHHALSKKKDKNKKTKRRWWGIRHCQSRHQADKSVGQRQRSQASTQRESGYQTQVRLVRDQW